MLRIATQWSSNCTTRYLPLRYSCSEEKGHMHPSVHSTMFTIAKLWKEPRCPSRDEWIKMYIFVHVYNGILLSHQKGWIPTICIHMGGTREDYAKWNKSSRERLLSHSFTYMWNIRNSMEDQRGRKGKLNQKSEIREGDKPRETMSSINKLRVSGEGGGGGMGLTGWWVWRRVHVVMSTGCYM